MNRGIIPLSKGTIIIANPNQNLSYPTATNQFGSPYNNNGFYQTDRSLQFQPNQNLQQTQYYQTNNNNNNNQQAFYY